MRNFLADCRAVVAIEFSFIAPVMLIMIGGGISLMQFQQQNATAQFLAQSGAVASATLSKTLGLPRPQVEAQVVSMLTTNARLTLDPATQFAFSFSYPDQNTTVATVTLSSVALFPMFADPLISTQNAAD